MLLSLFCGAGGLDLGFEAAGFDVGLAFDRNADSVRSYNHNRKRKNGFVADVSSLTNDELDSYYSRVFSPRGIIGGPPCQSFSQANVNQKLDDPRHGMPAVFAKILKALNDRNPVDFFVMENVVGLTGKRHRNTLQSIMEAFEAARFEVEVAILDAQHYGTPQTRKRIFFVGYNRQTCPGLRWAPPRPWSSPAPSVRDTIEWLSEPTYFERGLDSGKFHPHPNHWCMQPKSVKFSRAGALHEGCVKGRSFKTLSWDQPSRAVAYGHREVHIHPNGHRRLSVYEAMLLQGFPSAFELLGSMSSQIRQVSEAVPFPLARAVAESVRRQLDQLGSGDRIDVHRSNLVSAKPVTPVSHIIVG